MRGRRCSRCSGRGTVVKTYDDYGIADPKDVRCPCCDGTGWVQPVATPVLKDEGTEP
jgi:DnaJ-class molecular chaperone